MTTQPSPMDAYLRERFSAADRAPDRLAGTLVYTPELQGPPDSGHGGGTTAIFFELARMLAGESRGAALIPRPVRIDVTLHKAMPLGVPLAAEITAGGSGWQGRIAREGQVVAEAAIRPAAEPLPAPPAPDRRSWEAALGAPVPVPAYEYCLGCGLKNPRGAQVRFDYDEAWMWKRLVPQPHFRSADGSLVPGYHAIVGDELGWWLGALQQGECGLSSRFSVTLGPPTPNEMPLIAVGSRSALTTTDPKGRIWEAPVAILTEDWQPVAAARVQFAGSRVFTRMMLSRFLWTDDLEPLRRAFPRYREEITKTGGGA